MRTSRVITIAALTLTMSTAVAGCGSDNPPTEDPTSSASASDGTGATSSASSGPDVPANWQAASVEAAQLHVPPDWTLSSSADLSQTMRAPDDAIGISPGAGNIQANVYSTDVTEADLEELAELTEKDLKDDFTNLKRLPNESINGQAFFHFRGYDDQIWYDEYVSLEPDGHYQISVIWRFNKTDIDRKGAEALIAEIMPTYEVL